MKRLIEFIIIPILISLPSYPQRAVERTVILNPLFAEENNAVAESTIWMNSIGGWGEFGNYIYDKDKTHEWYQKLGLFLEFFRTGDYRSLAVLSNIEFIADPHNDINFNPRAIFWEEAFLYTGRSGRNFWQAGYYHRCKHDIDNIDYGMERSLIYGSIMGRYIFNFARSEAFDAEGSLNGDIYTIKQDYRKPESLTSPDTEDLSLSIGGNIRLLKPLTKFLGVSFFTYYRLHLYSGNSGYFRKLTGIDYAQNSFGAETALVLTGRARFSISLRYEYIPDTGLSIYPESADLLSIGVQLLAPKIK